MTDYRSLTRQTARRHGLDPDIFERQIGQESSFNPNARSPKGALGIAQIMPDTARGWGVDPMDPRAALNAAAANMATYVRKYGGYENALRAYNAGPGAIQKSKGYAETNNYVHTILGSGGEPKRPTTRHTPTPDSEDDGAQTYRTTTTTTPGVDNRRARAQLVMSFLGTKNYDPLDFATQARELRDVAPVSTTTRTPIPGAARQPSTPSTPSSGSHISPRARPGDPVVSGRQSVGGEHETAGLPGYPARDYFAPAGTHAVAPVSGTVIRLSGHDPKDGPTQGPHGPLGFSVYIRGSDGKTYFLTHMGSRTVKAGQRVRQGQVIGTVADYDKYGTPSHIHQGVSG